MMQNLKFGLPKLWDRIKEKRKADKFSRQLASVLDLCAGALRSGQSLNQALATLAQEAPQPSAEYFSKVSQEVALGAAAESALDALALELQKSAVGEELRMFSTAVSVTRATGGNLAELLGRLSETLRERERLRAEIGAMTAQGKLSGWIVGGLPLLILVSLNILDPDLVSPLFHTGLGLAILLAGAVLELLGALMIRRIVDIDA